MISCSAIDVPSLFPLIDLFQQRQSGTQIDADAFLIADECSSVGTLRGLGVEGDQFSGLAAIIDWRRGGGHLPALSLQSIEMRLHGEIIGAKGGSDRFLPRSPRAIIIDVLFGSLIDSRIAGLVNAIPIRVSIPALKHSRLHLWRCGELGGAEIVHGVKGEKVARLSWQRHVIVTHGSFRGSHIEQGIGDVRTIANTRHLRILPGASPSHPNGGIHRPAYNQDIFWRDRHANCCGHRTVDPR